LTEIRETSHTHREREEQQKRGTDCYGEALETLKVVQLMDLLKTVNEPRMELYAALEAGS